MWTWQALLLIIVAATIETYKSMCPYSSQRRFRSQGVCPGAPANYSCLFDTNKEYFMEYCNIRPDFSAPGDYYVFTGSRRNIKCTPEMYQPYSLWSNESSTCTSKKSLCTESGLIMYKFDSATEDRQCRCDYRKQFAFVITPSNRCSCKPSEEDCSCFIKQCGFGYILDADYECIPKNQRSETKCEDISNILGINLDEKIQKHNVSDSTNLIKSEKTVILVMITLSVTLLLLAAFLHAHGVIGKAKTMQKSERDIIVVAAIDLGTTSSGYASSTKAKLKNDPLDIKLNPRMIVNGTCGTSYLTSKTVTCILMEKNGNFVALGHEAQNQYADILLSEKADNYLFFDKFKMELYNNEKISKEMTIKDVKGRKMKAVIVFSSFIWELMLRVKSDYQEIDFDDIQWVLTVPAVWSDKAKDFMRHCAEKQNVRRDRLIIALEPEAVSVYFQYMHNFEPEDVPELDKRYVVVDIGGGTVDITAHEKTDDGSLMELCKCTGYDIGGTAVDKNFLEMFDEIVGKEVMNALLTDDKYKESNFDFLREVEKIKSTIFESNKDTLYFKVPFFDLDTLCQQFYKKSLIDTLGSSTYSKDISIKSERINFQRSSLLLLFIPVVTRILTEVRQVISEVKEINMILIAGGLSRSPVIVNKLKKSLESMNIITIPHRYPADLAVVMGAVLYGHHPHFISSRITKYTYGRLVQPLFDKDKHDGEKLITINGTDMCKDVFEILVLKNTRVKVTNKIRKEYKVINTSQKQIKIALYTTKKDHVDYVDDAECRLFCDVLIPLSETADQPLCVNVDFIFGFPEFKVEASDKITGAKYNVSFEIK